MNVRSNDVYKHWLVAKKATDGPSKSATENCLVENVNKVTTYPVDLESDVSVCGT